MTAADVIARLRAFVADVDGNPFSHFDIDEARLLLARIDALERVAEAAKLFIQGDSDANFAALDTSLDNLRELKK